MEKKKKKENPLCRNIFSPPVEIIPGRLFQYQLHLPVYTSSESGSPVKSILLWLVNQIIPVHRNLMDLFGWRQLPCPVLHTFSQEVDRKH